jgi:hypothetical protein
MAVTGSPIQESGTATRFLSIAYAPFFDLGPSNMVDKGVGPSFMWAHLMHALSILKQSPPVHVFYRAVEKLGDGSPPTGWFLYAVNGVSLAAFALFALWLARGGRSHGSHNRRELSFLVLFAVLLAAAYSTWIFGVFFFTRYFYPVYFIITVFAACLLQDIVAWASRRPLPLRAATAGVFALYAVGLVYMGLSSAYRSKPIYQFYDIAKWVDQNTDKDETIGVFQGGAIGYFSNRRVVNLDGKVNGEALEALRCGEICDYIAEAGIDVVMDHAKVLELFLGPVDGAGGIAGVESKKCFSGKTVGAAGWVGYRLNGHDAGGDAASLESGGGGAGGTGLSR